MEKNVKANASMRVWAVVAILAAITLASGCLSLGHTGQTGQAPSTSAEALNIIWGAATGGWKGAAFAGMLISFFMAVTVYMVSTVFGHKGLYTWAKTELVQTLMSAIIIGLTFSLFIMFNQAMRMEYPSSCTTDDCHITMARDYLSRTYDNVREVNKDILTANNNYLIASSLSFFIEFNAAEWKTLNFTPFAGFGMISDTLGTVFDILVKVLMLLKAQEFFLLFIQVTLFPVLLTLGIILRTFWFTRKLGGLLLAIGITLYSLYPLIYVLAETMIAESCYDMNGNRVPQEKCLADYQFELKTDVLEKLGGLNETPNNPVASYNIGITGILKQGLWQALSPGDPFASTKAVIPGSPDTGFWLLGEDGVLDRTAKILVIATFTPFIALFTTISMIKVLSPVLGGDVEIAGLSRLI